MDIYIKLSKKFSLYGRKSVYIKDIAEIYSAPNISKRVKNIKILEIKEEKDKSYLITVIDVINAVDKALTGHTINSVGETDCIVEYSKKVKNSNHFILISKIAVVCCILAFGSATAIMSFHSDAQMETIFENYYTVFFGEEVKNPTIINLPYSIGLAFGIIVFFNHFTGKKITSDPTPIEVEMSLYESQVTDNIIDTLNCERENGGNK
jgi:stage V sporulation protein AA